MEEYTYDFKKPKKYLLTVKLTSGEFIRIDGDQSIDMPELIAQRIENKEDIIVFGLLGVRRELIEWYAIKEIISE